MLDQIPEAKRGAASRAFSLLGAIEAVQPLAGGLSGAGVWLVRGGGGEAILKIERPPDGFSDPARQYACMAIAAEAGAAPELLFADPEAGVSLVRKLEARALPERAVLLREAARLLRRLHDAPPFPPLVAFPDGVGQLIARLQSLDLVDEDALAPVQDRFAELRGACGWGEDGLVASHNDPNPRNLIWDGERLWLIDWEAAFLNDPLVDAAIVANYFGQTPGDADLLLHAYLGRSASAREAERLAAMQSLCRIYYGVVLISSSADRSPAARRLDGPSLAEIGAALGAGRFDLADPTARFAYGAAMLREALA